MIDSIEEKAAPCATSPHRGDAAASAAAAPVGDRAAASARATRRASSWVPRGTCTAQPWSR